MLHYNLGFFSSTTIPYALTFDNIYVYIYNINKLVSFTSGIHQTHSNSTQTSIQHLNKSSASLINKGKLKHPMKMYRG